MKKVKFFDSTMGINYLLIFLFFSAFVLSFDSLNKFAYDHGFTHVVFGWFYLSWLWPLSIDAMIIASSISEYHGAKEGLGFDFVKRAGMWVFVFTLISLLFNVFEGVSTEYIDSRLHFAGVILVRVMPPVGMFISFEKLLMKMVNARSEKEGVVKTIKQIEHDINQRKSIVDELNSKIDELRKTIDVENGRLAGLEHKIKTRRIEHQEMAKGKTKTKKPSKRDAKKRARQQIVKQLYENGTTVFSRIAAQAGSTPRTVKEDLIELGLIDDDDSNEAPVANDGNESFEQGVVYDKLRGASGRVGSNGAAR